MPANSFGISFVGDEDCFDIRAGKMTQQLRGLPALTEDLILIPSTHNRWLTTTFNSDSRGSDVW